MHGQQNWQFGCYHVILFALSFNLSNIAKTIIDVMVSICIIHELTQHLGSRRATDILLCYYTRNTECRIAMFAGIHWQPHYSRTDCHKLLCKNDLLHASFTCFHTSLLIYSKSLENSLWSNAVSFVLWILKAVKFHNEFWITRKTFCNVFCS
jgi:hypothetical protein